MNIQCIGPVLCLYRVVTRLQFGSRLIKFQWATSCIRSTFCWLLHRIKSFKYEAYGACQHLFDLLLVSFEWGWTLSIVRIKTKRWLIKCNVTAIASLLLLEDNFFAPTHHLWMHRPVFCVLLCFLPRNHFRPCRWQPWRWVFSFFFYDSSVSLGAN